MDAYMDDDVNDDKDDDVGDDITILAHLLTAQYQRWAIFCRFSTHLQFVFSPLICFQPIYILVVAHLTSYKRPCQYIKLT
jgi:cellulose synthase/poly-beta-1,6-N-acetylglucosamine synthase-like glycosyltransferase